MAGCLELPAWCSTSLYAISMTPTWSAYKSAQESLVLVLEGFALLCFFFSFFLLIFGAPVYVWLRWSHLCLLQLYFVEIWLTFYMDSKLLPKYHLDLYLLPSPPLQHITYVYLGGISTNVGIWLLQGGYNASAMQKGECLLLESVGGKAGSEERPKGWWISRQPSWWSASAWLPSILLESKNSVFNCRNLGGRGCKIRLPPTAILILRLMGFYPRRSALSLFTLNRAVPTRP